MPSSGFRISQPELSARRPPVSSVEISTLGVGNSAGQTLTLRVTVEISTTIQINQLRIIITWHALCIILGMRKFLIIVASYLADLADWIYEWARKMRS